MIIIDVDVCELVMLERLSMTSWSLMDITGVIKQIILIRNCIFCSKKEGFEINKKVNICVRVLLLLLSCLQLLNLRLKLSYLTSTICYFFFGFFELTFKFDLEFNCWICFLLSVFSMQFQLLLDLIIHREEQTQ